MPDLNALTATVKCNSKRLFFSKKRKAGVWTLHGTVDIGKMSAPFDLAIIADGKNVGFYSQAERGCAREES